MSELPLEMQLAELPGTTWRRNGEMILPVLSAVISPRNSQPHVNPHCLTKQNSAHRHHCRVAATLPATKKNKHKKNPSDLRAKMLLFSVSLRRTFTHERVLCCSVRHHHYSISIPASSSSSLSFSLSVSLSFSQCQ